MLAAGGIGCRIALLSLYTVLMLQHTPKCFWIAKAPILTFG